MRSLLIVGAGSFSRNVDKLARLLGYTDIAYLEDNPDRARCQPVIGTTADIERFRSQYDTAVVALENNENRMEFHQILKDCGYHISIGAMVRDKAKVKPLTRVASFMVVEDNN